MYAKAAVVAIGILALAAGSEIRAQALDAGPLLPAESVWKMRYDTKLDGQVADKDAAETRWRLSVRNNRIAGGLAGMNEGDPKNHRLAGEVVDGKPPILSIRQDGPKGLICFYTGKRIAEGRIVGAWFDNRGGAGDFEFVEEKEAKLKPGLLLSQGAAALAFSPDGKVLATGGLGDGTVTMWDTETGKQVRRFEAGTRGTIYRLGFSADGKTLDAAGQDAGDSPPDWIRLWDTKTGKETFKEELNHIRAARFSPDRKTLAKLTGETRISVWDVASRKKLKDLRWEDEEIITFSYLASGELCALTREEQKVGSKGRGKVRIGDGAQKTVAEAPPLIGASLSPDGKFVVGMMGFGPCLGGAIVLAEVGTAKTHLLVVGQLGLLHSVEFSPDGKKLALVWSSAVRPDPGEVHGQIWSLPDARRLLSVDLPGCMNALAFSPDGKFLAAADEKRCLLQPTAELAGCGGQVSLLSLSPDAKLLAAGERTGAIQLLDMNAGKNLHRLSVRAKQIQAVAFSPKSTKLAAASEDGTVFLWETANGKEICRFKVRFALEEYAPKDVAEELKDVAPRHFGKEIRALTFSDDGERILVDTPGGGSSWYWKTGKQVPIGE